jgi:dethiobiotin synthetase
VTVLIVTGTDTGVGKTVTTAAIAAAAAAAGRSVCVLKPAQTGDDSDVDTVRRLAGPVPARALASYPEPLAPLVAAERAGLPPLPLRAVLAAAAGAADRYDLVLIEGAGGLLVQLGEHGWTVADLARELAVPAVVVTRAGLGTLNHTALTFEALDRRGIPGRLVIGAWPAQPEPVHLTNLTGLPGELAGVLPEGAGRLPSAAFCAAAPGWLAPDLFGTAEPVALRTAPPM